MCGRYTLLADEMKIRQQFGLEQEIKSYVPSYNVAPGQPVLTIIFDGQRQRIGHLQWGLVPFWAKDAKIGNKMINARSETIHEKPSFKHLLLNKRCLILADSFYEWKKVGDKRIPQRIQSKDKQVFAFAGLWDKWERNGKKLFTCTMLTRDSDPFMASIHHRMPIILPGNEMSTWLEGRFKDGHEVQQYTQSLKPGSLTAYAVSDYVNKAKNNDAACIEPIIL